MKEKLDLSKLYSDKGNVKPIFRQNKYTKSYIQNHKIIKDLINNTILLHTNATLKERIYCYQNNIKFKPLCRNCKQTYVSFNRYKNTYANYCSDICASKDRSSFYQISDETRDKIRNKSKELQLIKRLEDKSIELIEIQQKYKNIDFSKFDLSLTSDKLSFIKCNEHGEFKVSWTQIRNRNNPCPKCSRLIGNKNVSSSMLKDNDLSFIQWMKENKPQLLCNETVYIDSSTLITVKCPIHGIKQQSLGYIKNSKHNCTECSYESLQIKEGYDTNSLKDLLKVKFPDLDFSKFEYTGVYDDVIVSCKTHGEFITNYDYLRGSDYGCVKCGREVHANKKAGNSSEMIDNMKVRFPDLDFSKFEYIRSDIPSTVICAEHGESSRSYSQIMYTDFGCVKCAKSNRSKAEIEIQKYIEDLGFEVDYSNRTIIGKELDLYIPSKKFAIEFNGTYWHSYYQNKDNKKKHIDKTKLCKDKDIFLLHIWEYQWKDVTKRNILKSMIKNKLGITENKIYGRKTKIVDLSNDSKQVQTFLEHNHIQGRTQNTYSYGLIYNNELVSVMTFKVDKKRNEIVLNRFCNILNANVIGAFSKLLKHFLKLKDVLKLNTYDSMVSFADLTYSYGDIYYKHNFEMVKQYDEGYFYVKNDKYYHRSNFMKSNIQKQYEFDDDFMNTHTENELMQILGYHKLYDSGKLKFVLNFKYL